MHIFCTYGEWEDVGLSSTAAILVQEKRCTHCNKAKRRQTQHLGGSYSRGFNYYRTASGSDINAHDVFIAGYEAALTFMHVQESPKTITNIRDSWMAFLNLVNKPAQAKQDGGVPNASI